MFFLLIYTDFCQFTWVSANFISNHLIHFDFLFQMSSSLPLSRRMSCRALLRWWAHSSLNLFCFILLLGQFAAYFVITNSETQCCCMHIQKLYDAKWVCTLYWWIIYWCHHSTSLRACSKLRIRLQIFWLDNLGGRGCDYLPHRSRWGWSSNVVMKTWRMALNKCGWLTKADCSTIADCLTDIG